MDEDVINELIEALRCFVGSAVPVASEINSRGYNWCEPYLDEAREIALAALSKVTCDSGSRPTGRDVKQARGEARQSGAESASPNTSQGHSDE